MGLNCIPAIGDMHQQIYTIYCVSNVLPSLLSIVRNGSKDDSGMTALAMAIQQDERGTAGAAECVALLRAATDIATR